MNLIETRPTGLWFAALLAASIAWFLTPRLHGQAQAGRPMPHIGFAYPAGGQQGKTFTVTVGGQNLLGTTTAIFAGPGIQAKVVGYDRPMTQKELNDLREKLQQLQEKRLAARGQTPAPKDDAPETPKPPAKPTWSAEDEAMLVDLRTKLANRPNRPANPAIAEAVTLEVTLAPDATPGERELRLATPSGISNPVLLLVGELPEFSEPVVTAMTNPAPRPNREADPRTGRPRPTDTEITLPATVNGQILPGEVDRYHFTAHQGQRVTIAVSARALMPYLADAVPGWFQATLALFDSAGREIAYNDDYRFNPDPVLYYEIPADGEYAVEVKDSIYRGREDFVYRIEIGELPFVTSVFPLGSVPGKTTEVELMGWNLPANKLTLDTGNKSVGTLLLSVPNHGALSNAVRFALDAQPDCREIEPNDRGEIAQALTLPIIVNGRIDHPGDEDVFKIEGKAGTELIAEVFARRLNSPLDSVLRLTDASGRQIAVNDDCEDKGVGLITHQADSRISLMLPASGTYYLHLTDAQHQGGPEYAYRLRVSPPEPDFELRVVPSSINTRAGTHVPITVYAIRRDGFNGDIVLGLRDPPRGFYLSGARIPAGQDKVQLTLASPMMPREEPYELRVGGVALINGRSVGRAAVPAEDMMQAFFYRHLVPAKELLVSVTGRGSSCRVLSGGPLRIPAGEIAKVEIATGAARGIEHVQLELNDPPPGISVQRTSVNGDVVSIVFFCDAAKAKPGLQGNLIFNAFGERTNPNAQKNQPRVQRVPLGSVPAIPFEVIGATAPST